MQELKNGKYGSLTKWCTIWDEMFDGSRLSREGKNGKKMDEHKA